VQPPLEQADEREQRGAGVVDAERLEVLDHEGRGEQHADGGAGEAPRLRDAASVPALLARVQSGEHGAGGVGGHGDDEQHGEGAADGEGARTSGRAVQRA
jgi:hypothetical protein